MGIHIYIWWVDLDFFFGGFCIALRIDTWRASLLLSSLLFFPLPMWLALHISFLFLSLRRTGYPRV